MLVAMRAFCLALIAMALSGCGSALLQSETSPQLSPRPVRAIGAYVAGPNALAASFQANIAVEATRHGLTADNVSALFPPTRAYTNAEIRQGLAARSIDSVMIIRIGDAPAQRQYAGTILQERSVGSGGRRRRRSQLSMAIPIRARSRQDWSTLGADASCGAARDR